MKSLFPLRGRTIAKRSGGGKCGKFLALALPATLCYPPVHDFRSEIPANYPPGVTLDTVRARAGITPRTPFPNFQAG